MGERRDAGEGYTDHSLALEILVRRRLLRTASEKLSRRTATSHTKHHISARGDGREKRDGRLREHHTRTNGPCRLGTARQTQIPDAEVCREDGYWHGQDMGDARPADMADAERTPRRREERTLHTEVSDCSARTYCVRPSARRLLRQKETRRRTPRPADQRLLSEPRCVHTGALSRRSFLVHSEQCGDERGRHRQENHRRRLDSPNQLAPL